MESLLSANEDILIPPLSLGLKPGAAYIQNRRQASVFSSINQASPQGVQNIRFNLSSTVEWCDPASVIRTTLFVSCLYAVESTCRVRPPVAGGMPMEIDFSADFIVPSECVEFRL